MKITDKIGPYWGAGVRKSGGRDHLRYQASSIASYRILLPGMTNVSDRVRYYAFYCWLLWKYKKSVDEGDPPPIRIDAFIRRAEVLYGFAVLSGSEEPSIVGADTIRPVLNSGIASDIDLTKYAIHEKSNTGYFANRGGALRQYYIGPMGALGLVKGSLAFPANKPVRIPEVLPGRGIRLAEAFENDIGITAVKIIFKTIYSGLVKKKDLVQLHDVLHPKIVSSENFERKLLISFLTDFTDEQEECRRQDTITLFLEYVKLNGLIGSPTDLPKAIFYGMTKDTKISFPPDDLADSAFGWELFQANEYFHFSMEALFHRLLINLRETGDWVDITDAIAQIVEQVAAGIQKVFKTVTLTSTLVEVLPTITKVSNAKWDENSIEEMISRMNGDENAPAAAFIALLALYLRYKDRIKQIKASLFRHVFFEEWLQFCDEHSKSSLFDILQKLIRINIIDQHMRTAYMKIAFEGIDTTKFAYDNGCLRGIEVELPRFTTPRLGVLVSFLCDLGVLRKSDKMRGYSMTPVGTTLTREIRG